MSGKVIFMNDTDWQIIQNLLLDSGNKLEFTTTGDGNTTVTVNEGTSRFDEVFIRSVNAVSMHIDESVA